MNERGNLHAVLNGEIYNYAELAAQLRARGHALRSQSDTEIFLRAFEEWGLDFYDRLRGMFAFAVHDSDKDCFWIGRDPAGVKPLYYGHGANGGFFAASEAKALVGLVSSAELLEPGFVSDGSTLSRPVITPSPVLTTNLRIAAAQLRDLLRESVQLRIPPELPFAVFLSGGIDSSLILALAGAMRPDVIAITIGLAGSAEVFQAAEFCRAINVRHEVVETTFDELAQCHETVISHLEDFEPNLVRASLISYALARRAREMGVIVALAGEGADEHFGGYDDFLELSGTALESMLEGFRRDLHRTQLLRWDKMGMAHTLEVRTPFMDRRIVDFSRSIPSSFKVARTGDRVIAKAVLREAARGLVPETIRTRAKMPMDDGMTPPDGASWTSRCRSLFSALPLKTLDATLAKRFNPVSREEQVNLSVLLQYLPPEFISPNRAIVRRETTK